MKLPELKMPDLGRKGKSPLSRGPEVRMPGFVTDLYEDLRDRRLLPLVVLLLVAIIAAPILIGGSKKSHDPPGPTGSDSAVDAASFSVVPATPELQSYKKRLAHRRSVNPFNPYTATGHRTPSREEIVSGQEAVSREASAAAEATSTGGKTEASTGGAGAESAPTTVVEKPIVKATIKAQVGVAAVVKAGYGEASELKELELEPQDKLPPDKPSLVYTGASKKGSALFLMTSQVTAFTGEGHCAVGGAICQMVELKSGKTETFSIGYGETTYTVRLLGFTPIVKEETVEQEGKKIRVPHKSKGGKKESRGTAGSQPSPRWLIAHSFSK